jgi:ferredoxin-NADP reductase
MLKLIDNFLNSTTMYRVALYYLMTLWVVALIFSFLGILPYSPIALLISLATLLAVSWATNTTFAYVFKVPANVESIYISVFILALVITPALAPAEYIFLGWAGILAMASKYIFAIKQKHVFNPVAFTLVVTTFFLNGTASWWTGTLVMVPFVLLGGLMLVRKIKRMDLAWSFFVTALVTILAFSSFRGANILGVLNKALLYSPLLFFTFIMITEPLTTPPSRFLRILYGTLVGFLFVPQVHIGALYFTPELALLFGNIFSYLISPKKRLTLKLKQAVQTSPDTADFVFETNSPLHFKPGQYLEWTLGHDKTDNRGNRRYFTIASSPTEKDLRLGVKFYANGSTFKKALDKLQPGQTIIASQLAGEFVLPKNKEKKLVFIAGGIGITPFRSMIKYLIDMKEKRNIILIYSNRKDSGIAYKEILEEARRDLNLKTIYTSFVEEKIILDEVKDWQERQNLLHFRSKFYGHRHRKHIKTARSA